MWKLKQTEDIYNQCFYFPFPEFLETNKEEKENKNKEHGEILYLFYFKF